VPTSPASSAHAPSHAAAGTGTATTPQAAHGRS
jgi:hypothetical protein